jgi:hypothetical protein
MTTMVCLSLMPNAKFFPAIRFLFLVEAIRSTENAIGKIGK